MPEVAGACAIVGVAEPTEESWLANDEIESFGICRLNATSDDSGDEGKGVARPIL